MATSTFSILDALNTLCTSIPQWNARLDELNGQIALRQIELARLEESDRPPTRSIKNKGSTESLRPKDGDENPFSSSDDPADIQMSPFQSQSPKVLQNGFHPGRRSSSSKAKRERAAAVVTPPPPKANSNPRPSPNALSRQSSQPNQPTQNRIAPNVLRKRKTDSLASGESTAPKYRTRSMIIVYYDSTVQTAFEEMVKNVSGSRNAMRKGKMAAKMAEMRRAAEFEVGQEEEEDDDEDGDGLNGMLSSGNLVAARKKVDVGKQGQSQESGEDGEVALPKLNFVSTRQMGPPRGAPKADNFGTTWGVGMLPGQNNRGGQVGAVPSIFDRLDKGLEWCQSQCEHAAHQFLRDGECGTEIENIKKRLSQVRDTAAEEMERLKEEEAHSVKAPETKGREFKVPQVRKEVGTMKDLEVDDMEVDDDAEDEMKLPPRLNFRRAGQV